MFSARRERPEYSAQTQLDSLIEAAGDAVFRVNGRGVVLFVSHRTATLIGPRASMIGRPLLEVIVSADQASAKAILDEACNTGRSSKATVRIRAGAKVMSAEVQASAYSNAHGELELLVVGRDISQQQATEERLRHLATHDVLTGLPNRALLSDRMRMAIAQARRTGRGFTVITIDVDGFKKINDALGHPLGDALLCVAAERLSECLGDIDTLARVGGDEFAAVLPDVVSPEEIHKIGRRMISSMRLPFEVQGHTLYVGSSIGAAIFPEHGDSEVKLLAHADTAMYRAKETGKARCVIYSHETFSQPEHDLSMEAAMFQAVRDGEFKIQYQPIVDARSRKIMGFEALMRWERPGVGSVSPAQFIAMAEDNGLINLLGAWALRAACMQIKQFQEVAGRPLYVSVNVSPRQFRNDKFAAAVDEAMQLSGLDGSQLLLEITEGILMSDPEHAESLLHAMAARKVGIAIDDFGTGYSSLAYLKRFPIAALKIDRAFIKDVPTSIKDVAICNVVLSLASHLNLTTVAEGVENEAQMEFLASHGCGLVQGYLTGRPLMPEEVILLLQSGGLQAHQ